MKLFKCAICGILEYDYDPIFLGQTCINCSKNAIDENGKPPWNDSFKDTGSNPIFINGVKCYRIYKFGGYKDILYSYKQNLITK